MKKYICNYCLSEIEEDSERVFCDKCYSPYHLECFEDNGKCSAYGCNCHSYHREENIVSNNSHVEVIPEPSVSSNTERSRNVSYNRSFYEPSVPEYPVYTNFPEQVSENRFLPVLKCMGGFLYSGILCFLIWWGFYSIIKAYATTFLYDESSLYLSIPFLVGFLILVGWIAVNYLESFGVDSEQLGGCLGVMVAPVACCSGGYLIGPFLFYVIVGGILYLLTLPLSKLTDDNIISKIFALIPVLFFTVLTCINCYNMVTATFISVINSCIPFVLYIVLSIIILIDRNIIEFLNA